MIEGAVHFQFAIATGEGAWNGQLSTADQSNRTRRGGPEFGMRANSVAMGWMSKRGVAPLLTSVAKPRSRALEVPTTRSLHSSIRVATHRLQASYNYREFRQNLWANRRSKYFQKSLRRLRDLI